MRRILMLKIFGLFLIILALSMSVGEALIEGKTPSINSFIFLHSAGYLFFLLMPVELLFLYYLSIGHSPLFLIIIAVGTALISQMIDYLIGLLASKKVISNYIGIRKFERIKKRLIGKYRDVIIFFFNLTFLSSPIISLIAGILRVKIKYLIFYGFLGLILKYIILTIAYFQLY